jgi:NTP pyrophosphatase (non-canonical NTP hydrolase)
MVDVLITEMQDRMARAEARYGAFASTHEALGVALEEWDELRAAIRSNALASVEQECLDLAAVLMRLAAAMRVSHYTHTRSVK